MPILRTGADDPTSPAPSVGSSGDFQLLADSIPVLAWMADASGWIFWYNRRWYEYTGLAAKDMEGWGWQKVHDPSILPTVMASWQKSIADGQPFEMTFPLRSASGEFRPFLTRIEPLKDETGKVFRWFGTNTEVSREMQALQALAESEQRFRTATEAVNGILWTNNANGEMMGPQPGWSGFTGQTFEQYQGYGWASAVHPEDAQPTIAAWQLAVAERSRFIFEHRVRRHDGLFRLCAIRALPVIDPSGEIREWVGVHTDITDQREKEEQLKTTVSALRQQQELVESAQLLSSVGFWRFQPSTSELFLSSGSRNLLGLPLSGEVTADETFARIDPRDVPQIQQAIQASALNGSYQVEFRTAASPNVEQRWILGVARALRDSDGDFYLVGMNVDITGQRLASDALIRSEKLAVAGRLAASIAHEINNPLEAVTNLLYLLTNSSLDAEQRDLAFMMQEELARVIHITTHTLRFHRQSTQRTSAPLTPLLESVLALHEGRMRNAGVRSLLRLRSHWNVDGFESELRQVLANLIGNAIDAMGSAPQPRTLALRTRDCIHPASGAKGVLITVADTGCGISPEARAHIFDAFFTTKQDTGTGLGLWVSLEIIKKHQGSLHVRSRQQPKPAGTVFQLFLPCSPSPEA